MSEITSATMKAVVVREPGGPEMLAIGETPVPQVGRGEVLIRVKAAGLNRADIQQRKGHYPPPRGASEILGMEVSGHIAAIGPDVFRWKEGDAMCALLAGGGYAEYCVAPQGQCLPIPGGVSIIDAAALPEAAFTVWANLFDTQILRPVDSFLVQGGSSGIGTFAIQAACFFGSRVITTAGSKAKCDFCLTLGAEAAFNYREQNWVAETWAWSAGKGVSVILDMVGGDYFGKHIDLLANRGRLVNIATSKGAEVQLDLREVMRKRLIITGSTLRARPAEEKSRLREGVEAKLWPAIASGAIRPIVHQVFPLAEVQQAHRLMESSAHMGKILLEVS
ncbi:MAG: NAD(P)H-quinone oxidoreductase [Acidobacteriaceae bacterium]